MTEILLWVLVGIGGGWLSPAVQINPPSAARCGATSSWPGDAERALKVRDWTAVDGGQITDQELPGHPTKELATGGNSQLAWAVSDSPVRWLDTTTVDLGDLLRDEPGTYVFRFRNLTDAPLYIDNVRAGCGCTATDWVDVPTPPGEVGTVTVTYDAGVTGYFRKYVRVFFRDHRGGHKLWLEGFVEG